MVDHVDEPQNHEEKYSVDDHHYIATEGLHPHEPTEFHFEPAAISPHDDLIDSHHEVNESTKWDALNIDHLHDTAEVAENMECPAGFSKIGCCRCVKHSIDHDLAPTFHGMAPHELKHLEEVEDNDGEEENHSKSPEKQKKSTSAEKQKKSKSAEKRKSKSAEKKQHDHS